MNLDKIIIKDPWTYIISYYWNWKLMFDVKVVTSPVLKLRDIYKMFFIQLSDESELKKYIKRSKIKDFLYHFCNNHIDYEIEKNIV